MAREQYTDLILVCRTCGKQFKWSAREQRYYYDRDLVEPKHCPACREKRRQRVEGGQR
jgi:hypothetical protein